MNVRDRHRWLVCAAVVLLAAGARASWPPPAAEPAVRLHAQLPDVLDRDWLDRLGLFPQLAGVQRARFERAVWGGLLVRLEIADPQAPQGLRVVVRNLPRDHWDALRRRAAAILAGEEAPPAPVYPLDRPQASDAADAGAAPGGEPGDEPAAPADPEVADAGFRGDPLAGLRAWPEIAPPPAALPRDLLPTFGPVPWRGRWLALIDVGARMNVTGFNSFFTPMGQVGIAFGRGVSAQLVPLLGFYAGFGDMRSAVEDVYGEGRSNAFGFTLATLLRQHVSDRHAVYLEGGGGYHIRSLYWGSVFYDPRSGQYLQGRVLEQQDWGWQVRVGWLQNRAHASRPRLLDVGFGVQSSVAERWALRSGDDLLVGAGRDTWLVLSIRFWDGL